MIVLILKMCTSYFVRVSFFLSFLRGVLNIDIFVRLQLFRGTKFVQSVTPKVFIPFYSIFAR